MLKGLIHAVVLLVVILGMSTEACEDRDKVYGCTSYNDKCICSYGCKSEFVFANLDECKLALYVRRNDVCGQPKICHHGGTCLQISSDPRYKCLCQGTGYYGKHCEIQCPRSVSRFEGRFPYECVVI